MLRKSPPTHTIRPKSSTHARRSRPRGADFSAKGCEVLRSPVLLVVTDDSLLRWALYEALAAAHYRVLACRDEAHAREILPWVQVDLVLAIVDGDTWAMSDRTRAFLRERWPHLPILLLSHPVEGLEERAAEHDVADVLIKPFDVSTLVDTVNRIIGATQGGRERMTAALAAAS
jgi:DNA-binding response OmpR family regulator